MPRTGGSTGARPLAARLASSLDGPPPTLPRPLDAAAERWARLAPRARMLVAAAVAAALLIGVQARVRAAEARWGGAPVSVLVAADDLDVGDRLTSLRQVELPPAAIPPAAAAAADVADGTVLSLALPAGAVLTRAHVDARGPAAGLDPSLRAVPIPVEEGWSVAAGGWVDVWALGTSEAPAALVARSRPVIEVRSDGARTTALIGLHVDEVAAATEGLALGTVLVAHAPPP